MADHSPVGMIREESGNSSFIAHIFHLLTLIGCTMKRISLFLRKPKLLFGHARYLVWLWYVWLTQYVLSGRIFTEGRISPDAARPRDTFPLPVHNQLKPFCVTSTYTLIMRTLPDFFAKNATLYIQALLVSTEHCPIHLSYEQGFETRTSDSELHPKDN